MKGYQIEAFRELRLIEKDILAGKDLRLIHKTVRAKLNDPYENSMAIKIALECLEGYMNDKGIGIPNYVNLQAQIEEENKIIQEFIETRAQARGMSESAYCTLYGLKYENLKTKNGV